MIVGYDNLRKNQMMTIASSFRNLVRLSVATLLLAAPTQSLLSASTQSLAADSLAKVIAGAKEEGRVSLYEGQQPQAWAKIMAAFQKRYPFVTSYDQERLVAGATVTRVITEARAGISTADIVASGTVQMDDFAARGLLQPVDWKALGIPEKSVFDRYTAVGSMFAYVIGYNTDLVTGADIPKAWDDVLDPKWKGQGSWWFNSQPWATLAAVWDEGRAVSFLDNLLAQDWRLSRSAATVSAWLSSGETPIGIVVLHRMQAAQSKGAPVGWTFADPVPVQLITYGLLKDAKNPNAAKLLIHWLTTPEGAKVYEDAVYRGNPYVEGTEMNRLIGSRNIAYHEGERLAEFKSMTEKMIKLLEKNR